MKLLMLYRRRWWLIYLPILVVLALVVGFTLWIWKPVAPRHLVIGTGPAQSSYLSLAQRYASRLEAMGIQVDIAPHERPQDPLERLERGDTTIDVTFAQGLYAGQGNRVQALTVIGHEIIWIAARRGVVESVSQLRGKRIATSVPGSSNRIAAERLLSHLGIPQDAVNFSTEVGSAAVDALAAGRVDAVVHVATGDSQTAGALARLDGVRLLGVARAGVLARQDPRLRAIVMPQGSIELRSNLPEADLPTLVTQTHLLVRPDLHPALQRALLDVANELHVMTGFLEGQGVYPSLVGSDFPVSPTARRHARGDRPWVETLLPFGTAQWVELVLYALLPVLLLGTVLLLRAPRFIEWRVRAAIQHFYGELMFLEEDIARAPATGPPVLEPLAERLDALERQVAVMELPDQYADRWYTLREHLQQARERLHHLQAAQNPTPTGS